MRDNSPGRPNRLAEHVPRFPRLEMSVALAAPYYHCGEPRRGISYEYTSFYLCLTELFEKVHFYDFAARHAALGKEAMSRELHDLLARERPDLTIVPLFTDQFAEHVVEEFRAHTTTVAYFFDDDWRQAYAEAWAPRFDYVTTPRVHTYRRWRRNGFDHVIYSPFAFNHYLLAREDRPKIHDVTFVGGYHPYRDWLLQHLRRAGFEPRARGNAWPDGVVSTEDMVELFNSSKVNLNLSDSLQWDLRYLLSSHRAIRTHFRSNKTTEQLKARHFEIPGCGGFQLTYYTADLERMFDVGREVAVYGDRDELVDKVDYYLENAEEREAIADAGYVRAVSEHTYAHRFVSLVEQIEASRSGPPVGASVGFDEPDVPPDGPPTRR